MTMTIACPSCGRDLQVSFSVVSGCEHAVNLRPTIDLFTLRGHVSCFPDGPDGGGEPLRVDGVLAA